MQSLFEEGFCKMAEMAKKEIDSKFCYSRGIISVWWGFFADDSCSVSFILFLFSFALCSAFLFVRIGK